MQRYHVPQFYRLAFSFLASVLLSIQTSQAELGTSSSMGVLIVYENGTTVPIQDFPWSIHVEAPDLYFPTALILEGVDLSGGEYSVEQRVVTSISISDEGPHIDLLGWKHGYSHWQPLEKVGKGSFAFANLYEKVPFPPCKIEELKQALTQEIRRWPARHNMSLLDVEEEISRWTRLVDEGQYGAGASQLQLKVKWKPDGKRARTIRKISIDLPLGC